MSNGEGATDTKTTIIRGMLEWWKGQPFANSMAFLQLIAMGGAVYLAVYVLIPAERQAIQQMIEHVEDQQTQQIDRLSDSFDRALDRISPAGVKVGSSSTAAIGGND
jgi:hypothetical protein